LQHELLSIVKMTALPIQAVIFGNTTEPVIHSTGKSAAAAAAEAATNSARPEAMKTDFFLKFIQLHSISLQDPDQNWQLPYSKN